MRIIHTADWHLGKNLEGASRLDEQEKFIDFFVEKCEEIRPDLILIAGDVYDTPNPPARAEKLFYDALKKLSRGGECLSLVIAGNHDNPERLVSATPLAMEHGIIMLGTPKTIVQPGGYGKHQVIRSDESMVEVTIGDERAVILAVPYPSEKRLNEVFYDDGEDEEERMASYGEKIAALFSKLEQHFRDDTINLTVSHLFAFGADPAGSERVSSLGGTFQVGTDLLPQKAHYTALGHIHKPQILPNTDKRMRYSGSPIHYSISEIAFDKKFFVIDIDENRHVTIREEAIPIFKPIELWKADSIDEAIEKCRDHQGEESWVYIEVKTDRPIREDEIKMMKSFKKDILEIRPMLNGRDRKIDAQRIAELSFEEQFIEFYKAQRDMDPQKEMVELLMNILEEDEYEAD
ncbi:MAG: exonuclease SbcCD subunit D [Peptostreptococcaceae bacterium]|nr:exonuclease SbcCD subunit D [Peptostreptococcaceae bacterium]